MSARKIAEELLTALARARHPGLTILGVALSDGTHYPCPAHGLNRGLSPSVRVDEDGDWLCERCHAAGTTHVLWRWVIENPAALRAFAGVAA